MLFSGVEAGPFDREGEPVCVARPQPGERRSIFVCFDLGGLESGRAYVSSLDGAGENLVDGIVPNGESGVIRTVWLDAAGNLMPQAQPAG
ncbi:MAG TPA: hypothetical protein VGC32_01020 [Solirubrobacterales bacterium]